jgi:hypothetical protein
VSGLLARTKWRSLAAAELLALVKSVAAIVPGVLGLVYTAVFQLSDVLTFVEMFSGGYSLRAVERLSAESGFWVSPSFDAVAPVETVPPRER